jgi:GNAT superfamily N-acetyltransferase
VRAWLSARERACDVIEAWEHGVVARATRFPSYWDLNAVRVLEPPSMDAGHFIDFTDQALAGLAHKKIFFDFGEAAEPLRAGFASRGWMTTRLVWMRHERQPPAGPDIEVHEVPYDETLALRRAWHEEDFPGVDDGDFHASQREVALQRGARVLAVSENGVPIGFAQLDYLDDAAEISAVYVAPHHRGRGLGTALTTAAVTRVGRVHDLWICADDEDRPKQLYARLGFRPVWTTLECTRVPPARP